MGPIKHALIKVVVTRLAAVAGAGLLLIFQHHTPKQLIHLQADCKALIFIDSVDIFYDPYAKRIFFYGVARANRQYRSFFHTAAAITIDIFSHWLTSF